MRIIAGEARGRRLVSPGDSSIRPLLDQIRESVFAALGGTLEGGGVLDLYAGVGSFGLEALSRGARRAVFVEKQASSLALLRRNIELLGFGPRCEVLRGDALRLPDLAALEPSTIAVAFIDPPFKVFDREEEAAQVFERLRAILAARALDPKGTVLLRHPTRFKGEVPQRPVAKKTYGESVVLRFDPALR